MFDPNDRPTNALLRARAEYLGRLNGTRRPKGTRTKGVFHPSRSEIQPCCSYFLHDASSFYALTDFYAHCCSAEHVGRMYGVSPEQLDRMLLKMGE